MEIKCETCKDTGWLREENLHWADPAFGKLVPCPDCREVVKDPNLKEPAEAKDVRWIDYTE